MTSPTARDFVEFIGTAAPTVVITSPTNGEEVTAEPITIAWEITGTQTDYRVQVYDAETGGTLVYDSQWTASATKSHDITAGNLDSGGDYWVKVFVRLDDRSSAVSALVNFLLRLPSAVSLTGAAVEPWHGLCGRVADPSAVPGLRIYWDAVDPADLSGAGETFLRFVVYRRDPTVTSEWTRVGCLNGGSDDADSLEFVDYNVASRVVYEYNVVMETTDGSETYYSTRQDPPPHNRPLFDYIWLHAVDDPETYALKILATDLQTVDDAGPSFAPTWGRTKPVGYTRQYIERRFNLSQGEMYRRNPAHWRAVQTMLEQQNANGTIFCLRLGVDGEKYFVQWEGAPRTLQELSYIATYALTEVYYDEEVALCDAYAG